MPPIPACDDDLDRGLDGGPGRNVGHGVDHDLTVGFVADLLAWGGQVLRDLPWRRTRDAWAVLVSELMLQQTQVARVAPRYTAFLTQFPTPQACAAAPVSAVIAAWEGLGYNRRAVHLHRAAQVVVTDHGGRVPDDLDALQALPGVGAYTARAVLAFAFERDHGVLDTNAARVLARAVAGARLTPTRAQALADALVPAGQGWAWNQSVLELGALVCTKRQPSCSRCPVAGHCRWQRAGCSAPDPAVGSAGSSGQQSRFDGSDRQGRGRLVAALRRGPVALDLAAQVMGWPDEPQRAQRVANSLVDDGLAEIVDGALSLPT